MRGLQLHIVDRALLVLEARERIELRLRRLKSCGNRSCDLTAQPHFTLLGDVALFGIADLANDLREASAVELTTRPLEVRIVINRSHHLGVGLREAHAARVLVQSSFGNHGLQHLTVKAEGARLIHCQRTAELASDLLQPVGKSLTELLDGNFGTADLGQR